MPEVSVIIPTYNRAHSLPRAIDSVLSQTYSDFEIIVVDDASTDNTLEVIEQIKDNRIRLIRLEVNSGAPTARNTGIQASKGAYIAFLDDDDIWQPTKIEKHVQVFQNSEPDVGVVYSRLLQINGNTRKYIPSECVNPKEGNIVKELLKGNFIGTPASVVRRECFNKIGGFDVNLPKLQDWELWLRIARYYEFKYIPEALLMAYYSFGGVGDKTLKIHAETIKYIIDKHLDLFYKEKKILSGYYDNIGNSLYAIKQIKNGNKYFLKAFKTYPKQIKPIIKIIIPKFILDYYYKRKISLNSL